MSRKWLLGDATVQEADKQQQLRVFRIVHNTTIHRTNGRLLQGGGSTVCSNSFGWSRPLVSNQVRVADPGAGA